MAVWKRELLGFSQYKYIIDGITNGFEVGVNPEKTKDPDRISGEGHYIPLKPHERRAISEWVRKGVDKRYILGPFDKDFKFPFGKLYFAPLFVVPKPDGRFRTVVHMSFRLRPYMWTINELLHEYMKTVQYIRFKEVVEMVNNAGKGALLFLVDAQDAYYRVPVRRADWKYMGIKWAGKYWIFRSLQMGMSSSPRIYTAFADAVEYICVKRNKKIAYINGRQQIRHYIDDFFGAIKDPKHAEILYKALYNTFKDLGIPTKWEKCTSPATRAKILGWIYDTILRMVFLPGDKRLKLLEMVERLLRTRKASVKFLRQLLGRLQHASRVIFPGKAFVRKLEALLYLPDHDQDREFTVSSFAVRNLRWWQKILSEPENCGTSFDLLLKHPSEGDIVIYTDACTEIGGGGFIQESGHIQYFQVKWEDTRLQALEKYREVRIEVLELLMSLVAVRLVAAKARNKCISIYNDNPAAAAAIRTKAPRLFRLDLQYLTEELATLASTNKFYFWGIHSIKKDSKEMDTADKLSRFMPVDFPQDAVKREIAGLCDEYFEGLWETPRNLPNKKDIGTDRRRMFGLLLEDEQIASCERVVVPPGREHNILA